MRTTTAGRAAALLLAAGAFAAGDARAQVESPLLSKVQLNLVNPGGKSMAMGGAFVSLADDATAALANPAGLPQLASWQAGISGKRFEFSPKLSTANYSEPLPNTFEPTSYDVYRPTSTVSDLEYLSVVGPLAKDVSVALYRAVNLRYTLDSSGLLDDRYRAFFVQRNQGTRSTSLDEYGGVDVRNEVYGLSLGARLGAVSVGAGVTLNRLRYELTGQSGGQGHQFVLNGDNGALPDPLTRRNDIGVSATVTSGTRAGWIAGFRWDVYEPARVSVGGVFRRSPRFDVDYAVKVSVPSTGQRYAFSCGVDDPAIPASGASACGTFRVPDDFSVGVSAMPVKNLVVVFDVQRIFYSQLQDGFVALFPYTLGTTRAFAIGSNVDGTIPRVGLEYTVPFEGGELYLRAGAYWEPAHGMRLDLYPDTNGDRRGDGPTPVEVPPYSQAYRTSFDGGASERHVSFGIGTTLGRHLSVDVAADLGDTTRSFVVSAFYRF